MKKFPKILLLALIFQTIFTSFLYAKTTLTGAGATFPYPLYAKLFELYQTQHDVSIHYSPCGSEQGIAQFKAKKVDFCATEEFLNDTELRRFGRPVAHIPICIGAVAVSYHLPNNPDLYLSGTVLADIFLGKITRWNDPNIQLLNPHLSLPNLKIQPIVRHEGSGTTSIFSTYLAKSSPEWQRKMGAGTRIKWLAGRSVTGNSGIMSSIQKQVGSIGYVALGQALDSRYPTAYIQNASGAFIKPSTRTLSVAANIKTPADLRVSLVSTSARYGYPISGLTWILVNQDSSKHNQDTLQLVEWMLEKAQDLVDDFHYAPLPTQLFEKASDSISHLNARPGGSNGAF